MNMEKNGSQPALLGGVKKNMLHHGLPFFLEKQWPPVTPASNGNIPHETIVKKSAIIMHPISRFSDHNTELFHGFRTGLTMDLLQKRETAGRWGWKPLPGS